MTNEELLEELFFKAYEKGFFNEMHDLIQELKINNPKMGSVDLAQIAYKKLKPAQPLHKN